MCALCETPGFARGALSEDMPIEPDLRAKYLWGLLDDIDLRERAGKLNRWHLMAHGASAAAAIQMALQQPDSAASLFLLSPMLTSPVKGLKRLALSSPLCRHLLRRWLKRNVVKPSGFDRAVRVLYGRSPIPSQRDRLQKQFSLLVGHEDVAKRLLTDSFMADLAPLRGLFLPGMVIWGGQDRLLGGEIPEQLRKSDFPDAEYHVLDTAGHCAMETHPEPVRDFLRGWIREVWE